MKKSYVKIVIALFILPTILNLAGCSNYKKNILNENFIKKSILEKGLINDNEKNSFSLIDIFNVNSNSTIVGYKTNSTQGVVVFHKKNNKYNITDGSSKGVDNNLGVTTHSVNYDNTMDLVILGDSKSVYKIEVLINNSKIQTYKLKPEKPSMFILNKEIIKNSYGNSSIEFKYFDKNGNII